MSRKHAAKARNGSRRPRRKRKGTWWDRPGQANAGVSAETRAAILTARGDGWA